MTIPNGTRIRHYEILEPLGVGGMGEVYKARDTRLARSVALKFLPPQLQSDEEALARFKREAMIVSGLNHPHILTIHEIGKARVPGRERASHYMVTEFIDGGTLREIALVETDGRRLLEYLAQVADALQRAHTAGVVHRDLKPENIMVSSDGYAKVLDFGLAKFYGWVDDADSDEVKTERFQTQRGIVVGTIGYMSPEQVQGKQVDFRSDIFSFGCILYEILAGQRPFEGDHPVDAMHRIIHGKPEPLPSAVMAGLRRLVERCMEKDPLARCDSMREVAAALREVAREWDGSLATLRVGKPRSGTRRVSTRGIKSVAVLPFTNSSGDAEMEYLSDGIAESIIYSLSRVGGKLKVVARNTAFSYKGKDSSPRQMGQDMNVTTLVMGRVQRVGANLVVSIDLVDTRDGSQVWGESFRRPLADIFALQDEIATHIADRLRIQLSPSRRRNAPPRPAPTGESYALYLKGRFHWNKRTIEGVNAAIEQFERAIEVDPQFALAWAGLADCHAVLAVRFFGVPDEVYAKVEQCARRAIEIDPALAEPHATLGALEFIFRWNWAAAEREFNSAIRLSPAYATAHHWYSVFLNLVGRRDEALEEARIAAELEPLNVLTTVNYGDLLYFNGRYEDALRQCEKALQLDPRFFLAHFMMSRVYAAMRSYDQALRHIEMAIEAEGRYPELLAEKAFIVGGMGDLSAAATLRDELMAMRNERFVAPVFLAEASMAIGDMDAAIQWAEEFFRMRGDLTEIVAGPRYAPLRADPRYREMLARVGFPGEAKRRGRGARTPAR